MNEAPFLGKKTRKFLLDQVSESTFCSRLGGTRKFDDIVRTFGHPSNDFPLLIVRSEIPGEIGRDSPHSDLRPIPVPPKGE